jgi:hypothetical protein
MKVKLEMWLSGKTEAADDELTRHQRLQVIL